MPAIAVVLSAVGVSAPIPLPMGNINSTNLTTALLVNFSGGGPASATATVEISNDPLARTNPSQARWNPHDVLVNISDDTSSTLIAGILACRLRVLTLVSGSVQLQVGYVE